MPDRMNELLDTLARPAPSSAPPPAFLAAVARRRHRRRLMHAAVGTSAFAALLAATLMLRTPGPFPMTPGVPGLPGHTLTAASFPDSPSSLGNLARLNPGLGAENLVLPSTPSSTAQEPLYAGLRWDPAAVEEWITQ